MIMESLIFGFHLSIRRDKWSQIKWGMKKSICLRVQSHTNLRNWYPRLALPWESFTEENTWILQSSTVQIWCHETTENWRTHGQAGCKSFWRGVTKGCTLSLSRKGREYTKLLPIHSFSQICWYRSSLWIATWNFWKTLWKLKYFKDAHVDTSYFI